MEIYGNSFSEIYTQLRKQLLTAPTISPRGIETKELIDVNIILTNPQLRLGFHPERKFSLLFAISEAVNLFSQVEDMKFLSFFNKNLEQFGEGGIFPGAYGKRIYGYIDTIISKLQSDQNSRQAVVNIFEREDIRRRGKTVPCTLSLQFLIRQERLHLFVKMRSNDFYWGLPYDIFMFTCLHEAVAHTMDFPLGEYHHSATSLHVYQHHYELLERVDHLDVVPMKFPYDIVDMEDMSQLLHFMYRNNDVFPHPAADPFRELMTNEILFRMGLSVPSLQTFTQWAKPFVERWYK